MEIGVGVLLIVIGLSIAAAVDLAQRWGPFSDPWFAVCTVVLFRWNGRTGESLSQIADSLTRDILASQGVRTFTLYSRRTTASKARGWIDARLGLLRHLGGIGIQSTQNLGVEAGDWCVGWLAWASPGRPVKIKDSLSANEALHALREFTSPLGPPMPWHYVLFPQPGETMNVDEAFELWEQLVSDLV